jgi:hypothetical protein
MAIIDSMVLVDLSVRARVGGTPSLPMVRVSASPSRKDAVALGWEEVQLAGQCPQFGLGDQRIGDVVGGPHPLPARVQRCIRGIESKGHRWGRAPGGE